MGLLVDGKWVDQWYDTARTGGAFQRQPSSFRNQLAERAEPGRYRLYVSLACPWAHRTLIMRALLRLEEVIPVTVVSPLMLEHGWELPDGEPELGATRLHQIYTASDRNFTGRVTVPVLWDRREQRIVNNESAEIIRMLNRDFRHLTAVPHDFYPTELADEIERWNARIYDDVNNGVYKAGFATAQKPYDRAVAALFQALDDLEELLGSRRYLAGAKLTEADIRLFTTLIRFDPVYHGHFKCNWRQIHEYPNLFGWLREIHQLPGVAGTVDFDHIKTHYYASHRTINPSGVVPRGPVLDLAAPHGRGHLPAETSALA